MIVADYIAQWLFERTPYAFGIIGAGNASLFDSIARLAKTEIVCCHHEQAAVMAAGAYWRTGGHAAVALVTTGGGSANAITGVVSAWMDSIPILVISGNEEVKYCDKGWRGWGVQGIPSVEMVQKVTKMSVRIWSPRQVARYLDEAYKVAFADRPGPVWLDLPRDIQSQNVPNDT